MGKLSAKTFATKKAFGQAIINADPSYQGRDPEELGQNALNHPAFKDVKIVPINYGDIDALELISNIPGDILDVAGDTIEGFGQIIEHPIDSAIGIGKIAGGAADIAAEAIGLDLDIASDASEAAAGEFGRALKHSVSPEGLQNNPFEALTNVASVLPIGAAAGAASKVAKAAGAGKTSKALNTVSKIGRNLDPSDAMVNASGAVVKKVAQTPRTLLGKLSGAAKGKAGILGNNPLGPADFTNVQHVAGSTLGLPINVPAPALRLLMRDGHKPVKLPQGGTASFRQAMEAAQEMADDAYAPHMAEKAFRAADVLHAQKRQAYASAMAQLEEVMNSNVPRSLDGDIFTQITNAVEAQDMGIRFVEGKDKPFKAVFDRDIFADKGTQNALKEQVEAIANMGFRKKEASKILDAKGNPLNNGGGFEPVDVSWNQVHDFRQKIDDVISKMDPQGTSARQRAALINLRENIATILTATLDQLTPEGPLKYSAIMKNYSALSKRQAKMSAWIGAKPGQIDKLGDISEDKINTIFNGMTGALTNQPTQAKGLPIVIEMERLLNDQTLLPTIVAAHTKNPLGGGLVGRAAASEMARNLVGPVGVLSVGAWIGGLTGVAATLPAAVLISPRLMSRLIGRNKAILDALKARGSSVAEVVSNTKKRLGKVSDPRVAAAIRLAVKEGLSLEQLYQRLEDQGLVDLQDTNQGKSLISTLGQARN